MKTERMTLLISPADKAAIQARAEGLGMSVSELVRTAALEFDPDEAEVRSAIATLLPEAIAAMDRMIATFDRMLANGEAHERKMDWMRSPEGREQISQDLFNNPNIDWDHVNRALEDIKSGRYHRELVN